MKLVATILLLIPFICNAQYYKKARNAYKAKDFVEVELNYQKAIKIEETLELKDWLNLANSYRYQGKYLETLETYKKAKSYAEFKQEWDHLYYYAETAKTLGEYKIAKKWLKKYKKGRPQKGEAALQSLAFAKANQKYRNVNYLIQNEKAVNSASAEYNPMVFGDSVLTFASSRSRQLPSKQWTKKNINFLYQATIQEGKQLKDMRLFQQRDSLFTSNPTPICYNRDYRYSVSTFNHFVEGIRHVKGTFLDKLGLEIFPIEEYGLHMMGVQMYLDKGERYSAGFPGMGLNDTTLYFASDRPDGYGGFDIYKTTVIQDREIFLITKPINLGPKINTPGDEICPFIDVNGDLYFVSDYHEGFGGYDVFFSRLRADEWTKPENLGQPMNSSYDDLYYIYNSKLKRGYFTSNRPQGKGDYDIYSVEYNLGWKTRSEESK
ncbi:MAG: tetratricopeptide repeat protein [Aureispira sp.]|nr:tetratricopeptide repeat protein [Aureispira sp.]